MPPPTWHRGHPVADADGAADEESAPTAVVSTLERPRECINRHSTPPFNLFCTMMERIRSEEPIKRKDTLQRFMTIWRTRVGNDLYPLIRLLLPDRDRERPVYNLKEAMLARCYIEVLGLDKHSVSATRLLKWKQPIAGDHNSSGDFATVCYEEIMKRSTVEVGQFTIEAVNTVLDQLAGGRMKQGEYLPVLRKINQQCTPTEQMWIIRIILKDLKISMREKSVFAVFHPDSADLFNVCSDLKRVCWTLYKPEIRLEQHQTSIELFRSFLPQLCYRSPSSSHDGIAKLVGAPHVEFLMEEKLDGERMQLHMRGDGAQWYYCSRKAKDYTHMYGAHVGEGSLTQHISSAFGEGVHNIILDGEMLVWDPILEKYLAFGNLKTAALDRHGDENAPRPCFKIFDILCLNGKCLTNKRLSERKRLLRSTKIFPNIDEYKGRLEFADQSIGKTGKDIRAMLERILESRGEGLVVKRLDSVYETNSRGANWVKVKPEYSDQMGENLDLMVLGGWWGKGGRTGKVSSLLCGLRVQQEDDGTMDNPEFTSFLKIGSGMSYNDYEWMMKKHGSHWKTFDRKNPPSWMKLGPTGLDDKPDVYIEPKNSFVVEVKGSEIVPADGNFGIGYTMRFPRCRYIYWDKATRDHPPADDTQDRDMWNCLTADDFLALLNQPAKRYRDDANGSSRRKKRKVMPRKKVQLMEGIKGQRLSKDDVTSHIFSGVTFYIPRGTVEHKKADLEALVHSHGGDFTQAQLSDLSAYVIAQDEKSPLIRAQIKKGVSVIKPEWIFASIKRKKPLPLIKEFLVHASANTQDGRYYNKTLAEMDQITLVRDRGSNGDGAGGMEVEDEEEEGEEEEEEYTEEFVGADTREKADDQPGPSKRAPLPPPPTREGKSKAQQDLEEEWGLYRDNTSDTSSQATKGDDREEASDTEDEDDWKKRGIRSPTLIDDDDSEAEDEDGDKRLLPLYDPKRGSEVEAIGFSSNAQVYDEDAIFTHLGFYIDSAENARENGLTHSNAPKEAIDRLSKAEKHLSENGGIIVTSITDPKLTHIIMDDDDSVRYAELVRRTAKPKMKHIVLPSWVDECLDEETLMNEDAHKPK